MVEFDDLATFGDYKSGTKVTEKPQILFARLDEKRSYGESQSLNEKQAASVKAANAAVEEDTVIDIEPKARDHFLMISLRCSSRLVRSLPVKK